MERDTERERERDMGETKIKIVSNKRVNKFIRQLVI